MMRKRTHKRLIAKAKASVVVLASAIVVGAALSALAIRWSPHLRQETAWALLCYVDEWSCR
jgi:hypothetical protein